MRDVIKAHSFRIRDQRPLYDVEPLFSLLAGVKPYDDPRVEEPHRPLPLPEASTGDRELKPGFVPERPPSDVSPTPTTPRDEPMPGD